MVPVTAVTAPVGGDQRLLDRRGMPPAHGHRLPGTEVDGDPAARGAQPLDVGRVHQEPPVDTQEPRWFPSLLERRG